MKKEIKTNELARWIQTRKNSGIDTDFLYINTTCFGLEKTAALVSEVKNPRFVVVAGELFLSTFINHVSSPIRHILNGIRSNQNFSTIKKNIEKNDDPTDPSSYVFPDDFEFFDMVIKELKSIFNLKYKMVNKNE